LVGANFLASNQIVAEVNRTGGTGLYSPAVFEFSDYLNQRDIDSQNVIFLTWGLHSQPYFLNKGRFHINHLVFQLIDKSNKAEIQAVLKRLFSSPMARPQQGDSLHFPLYAQQRTDINEALIDLVREREGRLSLEKVFRERTGEEVIHLYRLDNVTEFSASFHQEIEQAPVSRTLRITRFGPVQANSDRKEDLPMWFIAEGLTPHTHVSLEGEQLLRTVYSVDHVTALVPWQDIQKPGTYSLFLYDSLATDRSEPVYLEVK
jgi:hypothetical protein